MSADESKLRSAIFTQFGSNASARDKKTEPDNLSGFWVILINHIKNDISHANLHHCDGSIYLRYLRNPCFVFDLRSDKSV